MATGNKEYSPSRFGVIRKDADLYHRSLIVKSVGTYEQGRK